jgi:hypothetical protein
MNAADQTVQPERAAKGVDAQRLDAAKALQESIFQQLEGSGQSLEVQMAIVFNILTTYVNTAWERGKANRGKVINLMTQEFRDRLQKFLPHE